MTERKRPSVTRALVDTVTAQVVNLAVDRVRKEWTARRSWRLSIGGEDDLYLPIHRWLTENSTPTQRRALVARTVWESPNPDSATSPALQMLLDGQIAHRFVLDGHRITVQISNGESSGGNKSTRPIDGGSLLDLMPTKPSITFESATRAGREAVEALLLRIDAERAEKTRQPSLMVLGRWGDWERRSDLPPRSMESVIIGGGVLDDLYADLRDFRDREAEYARRGIPYHRAYLLTGPPGTGKTSAVKAVTNALRMDLWYAQLSALNQDTKLATVLGSVRPHGVLLLEDIDSLAAAVDRTAGHEHRDVTTSGLLNGLDGVATPHGLVTIMTTNHPERLDPGLTRPGRIDRTLTFGLPDRMTIARHFTFFYGRAPRSPERLRAGRTSAEISELMKRHMDDPDAAEAALIGARGVTS